MLNRNFGRVLVLVYGILAFAATGRATFELTTKWTTAPLPYTLSAAAAVIYCVATWALATNRRQIAASAVGFEFVGVFAVGIASHIWTTGFPKASVWSDFGVGYGYLPAVLPIVGLWWVWRGSRR